MLESEKLPILGEGELMSRDQLQGFCSVMTVFKGKILGGGGGAGKDLSESSRQESSVFFSFECKVKVKSLSRVRLFAIPWTAAYQAPPPMGFSRQEHWNRLPFLIPEGLPDPEIEPMHLLHSVSVK